MIDLLDKDSYALYRSQARAGISRLLKNYAALDERSRKKLDELIELDRKACIRSGDEIKARQHLACRLHYVERLPTSKIARRLGVDKRQAFRYFNAAIDRLVSLVFIRTYGPMAAWIAESRVARQPEKTGGGGGTFDFQGSIC